MPTTGRQEEEEGMAVESDETDVQLCYFSQCSVNPSCVIHVSWLSLLVLSLCIPCSAASLLTFGICLLSVYLDLAGCASNTALCMSVHCFMHKMAQALVSHG